MRTLLILAALLATVTTPRADTVSLAPVADTTLFEYDPDNNIGAYPSLAAGGINAEPRRTRALLKFDVGANVPADALITSVRLNIRVVGVPVGGGVSSTFGLHRVLKSWDEGNKGGAPRGALATAGETTWNSRFHGAELWPTLGGEADTDYAAAASSTNIVLGLGLYSFETSPVAVADAQGWLNDPDDNHGWMLISEDEETPATARRFASRENTPANRPQLEITYTIPYRITRYERTNSTFRLFFPVEPQFQYTVLTSSQLRPGTWTLLTNFIERFTSYEGVASDSITRNPQGFYRVVKEPL